MCIITRFLGCTLLLSSVLLAASEQPTSGFETVQNSNAAILNRLGLAPLQIPDGHHKKRVAGPEPPGLSSQTRIHQPYSRRHGHRDSHVYVVKLPASPPYYTITKPHKSSKDDKLTKFGANFPVGFQGNGKPAKIYHWNLPVVKKISEKKRLHAQLKMEQAKRKLEQQAKKQDAGSVDNFMGDIGDGKETSHQEGKKYLAADSNKITVRQKNGPSKHVRNNDKRLTYPEHGEKKGPEPAKKGNNNAASNKTYRLDDSGVHRIHLTNELHGSKSTAKVKKHRKKAAMSYYAPITGKSGPTSIHKNFPGNGKPKAFYVMEKSRKPVYYHPLLP